MKPWGNVLVFCALVALVAACASTNDYLKVSQGMTKSQVTAILGNPEHRSFSGTRENWHYKRYGWGGPSYKIIVFERGRVLEMKDDVVAEQREHEIEKARAGATKIEVKQEVKTKEEYHY